MEKQGKKLMTKIPDSKVWYSFLKYIEGIHGKTYGYIGIEVQNALTHYIKNSSKIDFDGIETRYREEIQKTQENSQKLQAKLNSMTEEKNIIFQDYRKLRNKHDHLQERFNKSQKELNLLEKETRVLHIVVAKMQKMGLLERLLNRLPEEVKQLNEGEHP